MMKLTTMSSDLAMARTTAKVPAMSRDGNVTYV